jgi:hypothetical protein
MENKKSLTGQDQAEAQTVDIQCKDSYFQSETQAATDDFSAFYIDQAPAPEASPKVPTSPLPVKISPRTYACGIWQFVINKDSGQAVVDGINRDGFLKLINSKGYFKRYRKDNTFQYISDHNNIIQAVEVSQIRDSVTSDIEQVKNIKFEYAGLTFQATAEKQRETFFRSSPSIFNDAILGHLPNHDKPLLHDNETTMFFPFQNCVVSVTDDGICQMDYNVLPELCIWKDHIINRTFSEDYTHSQYADFIKNVCNSEPDRINAFHSAIGYILHNYSYPTTSRAVIAYDEQISGKNEPAGGSGKGIFNQAISQLRNVANIDGKKVQDNNRFSYQRVTERTQVICFDDVKPDFDFLTLNSNLSEGWTIEHKNKPSFRFEPTDNPKTYITSNTILKSEGTTAERRQFIIEFSDHYSKLVKQNLEPIIIIHGGMFFSSDWSLNEWNRFFSFMLTCAKYYLKSGLQFYKLKAVSDNKLMQSTSDDFAEWIKTQSIEARSEFNISELFADFKATYYGSDSDFKQRTFTNWLKIYAITLNCKLEITHKGSNQNKYSHGKLENRN